MRNGLPYKSMTRIDIILLFQYLYNSPVIIYFTLMKPVYRLLLVLSMLIVITLSCEIDPIDDSPKGLKAEPHGTLRVLFKKSHVWLPEDKMVRTDLHFATDGIEIYKGNYIYSANVNDYQESYDCDLPTGIRIILDEPAKKN